MLLLLAGRTSYTSIQLGNIILSEMNEPLIYYAMPHQSQLIGAFIKAGLKALAASRALFRAMSRYFRAWGGGRSQLHSNLHWAHVLMFYKTPVKQG